jgi:hypothetical protein
MHRNAMKKIGVFEKIFKFFYLRSTRFASFSYIYAQSDFLEKIQLVNIRIFFVKMWEIHHSLAPSAFAPPPDTVILERSVA